MRFRLSALWGSLAGNFLAEAVLRIPSFVWDAWAARKLTRVEFGIWIGFRLLLQVTPYIQGVTLFGLDLRYSHLVGADQSGQARRTAGSALIGTILCTALLLFALMPALPSSPFRHALVPGTSAGQMALFMAVVLAQTFYSVVGTHLRNRLRFHAMNIGLLVGNVVGLVVLFVLLPRMRVYGCLVAFLTNVVVCTAAWLPQVDIAIPDRREFLYEFKQLARLGLPLVAAGGVLDGLRLVGRWFVSYTNGIEALGTYGMAYIFSGIVFLAGTSSSRVLVQFMGRAEGAKKSREYQAIQYLFLPGIAVAAVGAVSAQAVWIGAQWFVPIWAPKQVAVLDVLRPAIFGALPFSVAFLYMTLLRAQGRLRDLILATGGTFAFYVAILAAVSMAGASLKTFVIVEAGCFGLVAVVLIGWTGRSLGGRRWWFLATLAFVFGVTIASMEAGSRAAAAVGKGFTGYVVQLVCAAAGLCIWVPVAWAAVRRFRGASGEPSASFGIAPGTR